MYLDNNTDTLTFLGITNQPNDQVIVMKVKFQGPDQYPLIKNQAYYYSTTGGDVIHNEYKLVPNSTGQFIITKYDAEKKLVEGNFELDLKNTWSYSGKDVDTLKLSEGSFKSTIAD